MGNEFVLFIMVKIQNDQKNAGRLVLIFKSDAHAVKGDPGACLGPCQTTMLEYCTING